MFYNRELERRRGSVGLQEGRGDIDGSLLYYIDMHTHTHTHTHTLGKNDLTNQSQTLSSGKIKKTQVGSVECASRLRTV